MESDPKVRTVYGTERKAIEETNRFVAEVNRELLTNTIPGKIGTADATKITFGEYVAIWLDANKNNGCIKRHTWRTYNGYAKNYVLPLWVTFCCRICRHITSQK